MDDLALIGSAFKFADLPFDEVGRASLVHRFPLLLAPEPWFRLKVGIVLLAMRLDEERALGGRGLGWGVGSHQRVSHERMTFERSLRQF